MKSRPLCFACLLFLIIRGMILILVSGDSLGEIPASSIFQQEEGTTVYIRGQVYKKSHTSNIQILYLKNNSVTDSNLLVYDENFIEVPIGKTISFKGKTMLFERARNLGNFDPALYYAQQGFYGSIWCEEVISVTGNTNLPAENLHALKMRWQDSLVSILGEKNGFLLSAMLLGEKGEIDDDIKELYQICGISHVLAISGFHISFIGLGIYHLLRKMGMPYAMAGALGMGILSIYILMLGFSISVIRAFVMLLIRIVADMTGRIYDMPTALMFAAAITVAARPLSLVNAGFYLSYGAILGILCVLPAIRKIWSNHWKWLAGLQASLAIQVMLFPIMLWFYFEISTYSVFLNVVVIPLMSVLLGLGMTGSFALLLLRPIGKGCLMLCGQILDFIESFCRMSSNLPMARLVWGRPAWWKVIFYYVILTGILLYIKCYKTTGKRRLRYKCLISLFVCSLSVFAYRPEKGLQVTMLDVGQGDCIFLKGEKGDTYLIDGGSTDIKEAGKYRIEPYLKYQGVKELDYVFVTHGDADHYSGILEMLRRQSVGISVKSLVLPCTYKQDLALVGLAEEARKTGVSVYFIKEGETVGEGDLHITCLQPAQADKELVGNEGSLVLEIRYRSFSMLCTGDVEEAGEDALLSKLQGKDYDILKVAHHGSKNATSEAFLKLVQGEIALISSGEENRYGHPHPETLERLKTFAYRIYQTKENGAITIFTDGNSLTISRLLYRL